MTAVVLHLSDIHIRSARDPILGKGELIAACVYSELAEASAVFIVVSGDIAFSGKVDQYQLAEKFFDAIRKEILAEKRIPVHFILVPGNHDCDFDIGGKPRILTLNAVREDPRQLDDDVIKIGVSAQAAFQNFAEQLQSPDESRVGDPLWTAHRFTVEGKEIIFDGINVAWCSNLREEPGTLIFPVERYKNIRNDGVDLRISVLHQPLNWFSQATYHAFRRFVRQLSNVVISGHEHVGGAGEDIHTDSGHSAYVEGCVLQGKNNLADSSFNVLVFNLEEGTYRSSRFLWKDTGHYTLTEEGTWSDFRDLPKKTLNRFVIETSFEQLLADPGGAFSIKGSSIGLQDLYVYPDVQEATAVETRGGRKISNSTIFHDASRLEGGVLLTGEEKVGATSLLYTLFRYYHERGLVPVYIRGSDIKSSSDAEIDKIVRRSVIEQYGEKCVELFNQKPSTEKILLLDDFDDGPVKHGQYRAKVLTSFTVRFPRMLVTANEILDFNGSIRPYAEGKLSDLKEYKLLPFGYSRRAQLVRRWVERTGADGSLDEAALLARCDQAERMLDAVMAKNIVPSLPLYLLTLLQSFESGVQGGFEDSGLGEYYDYLVKAGLESAHVHKSQWGLIIEYCSHLAWQMHATEHKELSQEELTVFNDRYSREQIRVELEPRIALLLKARILTKNGEFVRFRYHYIYYFLKGRHLSKQLDDLDVQAYIRTCCAHLYVRENANTILFLAHHAFKDPMFLTCVTDAINEPFKGYSPIAFNGKDTEKVKEFVKELPELVYSGKTPEKARAEANQTRDELDDGSDGLADKKEDLAQHEFTAQAISLLKTVEILGQMLKNQIASIPRSQRVDLLKQVMCGPLRAVNAFFSVFMSHQSTVEIEITELLAKKKAFHSDEERQKAARQLLAWLLQSSAAGLLIKAVVSISSDDLMEDIRTAANSIGTPASKLISVGVKLDGPGRIPREIERISQDLSADFIATRVLQILVLRRLYMFRTEEADRQWLASKKIVDLKYQQALEYKTRETKLLPGSH
ncbi:metallophosphoesterase [Ramlibacter sp. 2FC]|uniref:STAND family AAA ATPase n=1 Tax=Ramlibacter sp. 2FC TaxID=2502188 RepID=UPI0010F8E57B|nr:metallophosphoesterase [Ramlibacter sp. 2FC]